MDIEKGKLTAERYRIPTPQPSVPDAVADTVAQIVMHFGWEGPIGCAFPAVVKKGIIHSAANVDVTWIGTDCKSLLEARTDCLVLLLNDADAASLAEMTFGAGKD